MKSLLDKCACGSNIYHSKCLNVQHDLLLAELKYQAAKNALNEKKAALFDIIQELGGSSPQSPT